MIKKTAIVALILLLVGIVGSVFTFQSINKSEDVTEEKVIDGDFKQIKIITDEAKVEVLPTSDTEARVELSGKSSNYRLASGVEESTLKVDVGYKQKKLFNFDFTSSLLSLKVYVPKKVYDSIQIESDNERVKVDRLQAKQIHAKTDNGSIKLNDLESSKVTAEADNGTIDLNSVVADTVMTEVDNGKIILDQVDGKLSGKTNNGSISLITQNLDRPIDFETDNGKVKIQTEKEPTNVILDVKLDNGKADILGKTNWDTVIGDGKHLIKLTAKNGTITVTK
ncbi:DUF4097 family beta strand repeat-containing protein [Virgibacillus sp. FSP13]